MRTVTLEEHFVTQSFLKATSAHRHAAPPNIAAMEPELLDLGAGRIAAMDEAGIDLQVLSLASMGLDHLDAETTVPVVAEINDELAQAVAANPTRLAGFATLPLKTPEKAAQELERCIRTLGFKGALLDGTTDGLFLDDPRFTPVFEAAVALDVPLYLHPAPPPQAVYDVYFKGLPGEVGQVLSIAGWGWHAETALHTLRLIVAGVFDRFPTLQLIIGHMGEMLPMALTRTSSILSRAVHLKQPVAGYLKSNVHITTSGYFSLPPLRCALDVVGIDRLMFSVDYPFSPNARGAEFLKQAATILDETSMQSLAYGNASKLLKL